ncbi:SLC13 family permease [Brevundimonas sp.]|uniref:SLC13 family permease n=1 Tax=Brevundimonas sp. TaxID=1871086 RepID=UPI002489CF6A|nr:SLC13 family permease [Brevundimonas sp.]MDI1282550.1 SLC13 family permease [Brevundimonas sp.]
MTLQQGLAFGLVGLTIAGFVWGRFRYDLIALAALVVGMVVGVVPTEAAFDGFRNDITIIIAAALVVSAAFSRSGIVELALRRLLPLLKTEKSQVPVLTGAVTLLSMVTKNVGALAIMLPVALSVSRKTGSSPSRLLMPMAFGAMAGGMVTLVGTAPNIIVAGVRQDMLGQPFAMFDYAPVGLALTAIALAFLAFGYRLLPKDRQRVASLSDSLATNAYTTEVRVPDDWAPGKRTVTELVISAGGAVRILAVIRDGRRMARPRGNVVVRASDLIVLDGEAEALDAFVRRSGLTLAGDHRPIPRQAPTEDIRVIEAVVGLNSPLLGQTLAASDLHGQYGINLLGVSRAGYPLTQRLRNARLRQGDIILLQGSENSLPEALGALDLLPLAERSVGLGGVRKRFMPAVVLTVAMLLVGFQVVPVAPAFFGAAVTILMLGGLKMKEAYQALDGPLLVLIAALIPVSAAIQTTGGSDLIANALGGLFQGMPGLAAVAALMVAAMAVTPFLNNAATVLILAPIGATLATRLGFVPDAFLMAVAVGAACDFLTPVGHQCNTLVMGPGGYRFGDYARLGAPLSLLVLLAGPPLILLFWPL